MLIKYISFNLPKIKPVMSNNKLTTLLNILVITLFTILNYPANVSSQDTMLPDLDLNDLKLRNIGPAFNGGRIADIDFHPDNDNIWYVAVGSGGVWKTENAGTTWDPIFDSQDSYSIGSVTIDPNDPSTVWVGTGEDVGGRHVGYGDGVYKSTDDGKTWKNMGLENSEHISTIIIHPDNSNVVWVSVQGPLWSSGGERGLYKTNDGGESWNKMLGDDEWTGVTDIVMDPRDPDVLYAATWQRHRTVAAYMGGGPESGIHKSTDGGNTWRELKTGLPSSNMGKIGLAISPQNPDYVYAAIELERRTGGVYTSMNRGESWQKMSDAVAGGTGPHYYQELYASPHHFGRLYLVSNVMLISDEHGKNFTRMNVDNKHVDDHAIAFKKNDPDYILVGTDGGLYETYDHTKTWRFIRNLPLMQYYKISVDDEKPFYNVYGGTQDNGSNGGPSRTDNQHGIRNADWFKTLGADGHDSATEPGNPNIVYAETQQGGLHRVDRKTGEQVFIQPQPGEDEDYERYNWDAPIEVSNHDPKRLYFASQRVWRSDNRGDSWTPISDDLTRNQERIELSIMGRQQSWDNPWDVLAMSNYNTITSLAESPLDENLVYAGTDDGLLQVTEDGGENWRQIDLEDISGIPSTSFVNDIKADLYDVNTVYVALDNHKDGDFSPYLIKSTDRGRSWSSISGNLPDRHLVWRMVQDHEVPQLLFAATEFGIFFTLDGGQEWIKLKGGVPAISFRDIEIQKTHNDLVGGTFGRGIFILDDYTPIRNLNEETLSQDAFLFQPRDAFWYIQKSIVSSQGDNDYRADNPPFGALFTYYLKEAIKSKEEIRIENEKQIAEGEDIPFPGWDELEEEMRQKGPFIKIVIKDSEGNVINRVDGPAGKGLHRINWNLRHSSKGFIEPGEDGSNGGNGFLVIPGTYSATLVKIEDGVAETLSESVDFEVIPLREGTLQGATYSEIASFREEIESFQQQLGKTSRQLEKQIDRIEAFQAALNRAESEDPDLYRRIHDTRMELLEMNEEINGSEAKNQIGEKNPPSPGSRMFTGFRALNTTYGPTELHKRTVEAGKRKLESLQTDLNRLINTVMPSIERALVEIDAPPVEDTGN